MQLLELFKEIESILSVVEDGEYENADLMLQSLRQRIPTNHSMAYDIKKAHEAVQQDTYPTMLFRLENIMEKCKPIGDSHGSAKTAD